MPLQIVRNDITRMHVDALVNSANPDPVIGLGVDSVIHEAAGPELLRMRAQVGRIGVGEAACTGAGRLPARMVIHTVGPLWQGGNAGETEALAQCYRSCLEIAARSRCRSIAFPLLSTGTYGFPKDRALRIATQAIGAFLEACELDVYLVVYDRQSYQLSRELREDVENFIADTTAFERDAVCRRGGRPGTLSAFAASAAEPIFSDALEALPNALSIDGADAPRRAVCGIAPRRLEDVVEQVEEGFSEALLRLIDERDLTDPEVYKRANIDRKLFSKIRSKKGYQPSKPTALALAVALRLDLDETRDLIARAGYALTHANKGDIIVEYFIVRKMWDVMLINETLFAFDQPLIGR